LGSRSCSSPDRSSSPRSTTSFPRDEFNAFLALPDEVGEGIRLGVKDLFDTAGLTTTYGSAIFRDHVPERTAKAVDRFQVAGYAIVGKTNLHEFAYGTTSENPHFGDVVNPLNRGRIPGGSSGGSAAALAAGLCDAALGTDSAGSIRIPAACCGIVGFKPTHGLVPMDGCWPLAPSYDTGGPMGRDVVDVVRMMYALVPGFSLPDFAAEDITVGIAWLELADPLVRARVEEVAELFPNRRALDLPLLQAETYPVFAREVADVHRDLFAEHAGLYGSNVRTKIERCLAVTDEEYERALAARERYVAEFVEAAAGVDLVVSPTLECVAPPRMDDLVLRDRLIRLTYPFNATGWPALALPCGPAEHGLPASVSLAAARGQDDFVLGAGLATEAGLRLRP
jgi:aspartyl-tRNA(Asn)/glutamyl-tRNA(Gln) amidotransferase subunit A